MDRPTFTPSIRVTIYRPTGDRLCHSFVTDGYICFLPDSTHSLAGQTVPLPDWPHPRGGYGGIEE
jgi:hypothetical protein